MVVNTFIKLHCSIVHLLFPSDNTDNAGLEENKKCEWGKGISI